MQDPNETADAAVQVDDSFDSNFDPAPPEVVELPLDSQASDLLSSDLPSEVAPPDGEDIDGVEVVDMPIGCDATNAPGSDAECPVPGVPCDDGNPCTSEDQYSTEGICAGQINPCDDGEVCTQDHCWAKVGCTHVWTPGCGGKLCGECPEAEGFECVFVDVSNFQCVNKNANEVFVPAGVFWFGWNEKISSQSTGVYDNYKDFMKSDKEARYASNPTFVGGYAIDTTRITFPELSLELSSDAGAQYRFECADFIPAPSIDSTGLMAMSYADCFEVKCKLAGKRLCTEFEWEKAATGGAARLGVPEADLGKLQGASPLWPWGDVVGTCAEVSECSECESDPQTSCYVEISTHPQGASSYGVHDLISREPEATTSKVAPMSDNYQKTMYDELAGVDGVLLGTYSDGEFWTSDTGSNGVLTTKGFVKWPSFMFSRHQYFVPANSRCCRSIESSSLGLGSLSE
ncbi:MAG: hypothetical protein IV100_25045 [Myxococcales bacterium]|nr:hypothetical protein [Myxococcales bacterium]